MKSREVIGRRIVGVEHYRFYNEHLKRTETVVDYIRLDDGSILCPFAFETIDTPQGTIQHVKPLRRNRE
jgi:hypothetical protein